MSNCFILFRQVSFVILFITAYACENEPRPIKENLKPIADSGKLLSNNVLKICVDSKSIKWILTDSGLCTYNGEMWKSIIKDENVNFGINGIAMNGINNEQTLLYSSAIGLNEQLFHLFFNDSLQSSFVLTTSNSAMASNMVSALYVFDTSQFYVGTSLGLSIYKNNKWFVFTGRKLETILDEHRITAVAKTKGGWIFAATEGGGVARFKYETDAITGATTYIKPWAWGLKSDTVYCMMIVEDSCQWFGTNRGATYHSKIVTKRDTIDWKHVGRGDGLICDTVLSIAQGKDGAIWFGTAKGVSKFYNSTFTNYTTKNGLSNNRVNSIAIDLDGSVWFGTANGLSHFVNNRWERFSNN